MNILPFSIQQIVKFSLMTDDQLKIEIANRVIEITQLENDTSLHGFCRERTVNEELLALVKILETKKIELS